jgi:hypothetical protein
MRNYKLACGFVGVLKLVSYIKGKYRPRVLRNEEHI